MFRYLLALLLASTSSMVIANPVVTSGVSTGNDGYTVHLVGTGFAANSYVDVRTSTTSDILASYSGSSIHVVGTTDAYLTITDATQRSLFLSNGLYFWVVNPTPPASWSSGRFVQWTSPPPPELYTGESTGSDGYTIHLTGQFFHTDSHVDVRSATTGSILATYSGAQVTVTNDSDLMIYISDITQRNYLNSTGLYFWVVNLTPPPATFDGPVQVIRTSTNTSSYDALSSALTVTGTQTLLQRTISLSTPKWLFMSSDGNVSPVGSSSQAFSASISLDNVQVSDVSTIAWFASHPHDTHSFNAIAAQYVPAGTHVIKLVAVANLGSDVVGAGSNLSVMVAPATNVVDVQSPADVGPLNFNTYAQATGNDDRSPNPAPHPFTPVATSSIATTVGQPLIAFASGIHFQAGSDGDSAIGLWVDNTQTNSLQASWGMNDICGCAEQRAPYYLRAYLSGLPAATHQVVLGGSEFYWSDQNADNPIIYKIGAGSHLIAMSGGMHASGVVYSPSPLPLAVTSMLNVFPVTVTRPATIASGTINIPSTSSGVVYFSTTTRQFGDTGNATLILQLKIDGVFVGSQGKQTCGYGAFGGCVSARTMTASYLAAGANALSVGNHSVQAIVTMQSTTSNQMLNVSIDAPVIWFD